MYWEHLLEYELTILRDVFLKGMENVAPGWIEEFEKGAVKANFEAAVGACDDCLCMYKVLDLLDALENGENWNLRRNSFE
jgi:hypothetical protein